MNIRRELLDGGRRLVDVLQYRFECFLSGNIPRQSPRIHLVGRHRVRIDVDALVRSLSLDQLGSHVIRGPGAIAGFLKIGSVRNHESKVDELHNVVFIDHHITGTKIAVNPVLMVQVTDGLTQLNDVVQTVHLHLLVLHVNQIAEADTFDEIHDQIRLVSCRHSMLNGFYNIEMLQTH